MLKERTILLDGDILAYQVAMASCAKSTKTVDGVEVPCYKITKTEAQMEKLIEYLLTKIKSSLDNKIIETYLTGTDNFRFQVATLAPYKGQRPSVKPPSLPIVRDILVSMGTEIINGQEADDELSIRSYELDHNCTIASLDKDLLQVPCGHYFWGTAGHKERLERRVSPEEARHRFYCQILTGDRVDNIPGLYGLGAKRANAALEPLYGMSDEDYGTQIVELFHERECRLTLGVPKLTGLTYDISSGQVSYCAHTGQEKTVSVEDVVSELGTLLRMKTSRDEDGLWRVKTRG